MFTTGDDCPTWSLLRTTQFDLVRDYRGLGQVV